MSAPTVAPPTAAELADRIDRAALELSGLVALAGTCPLDSTAYRAAMDAYGIAYDRMLADVAALLAMVEGGAP